MKRLTARDLEALVRRYNRREAVGLDPVGFLYRFDDVRDREIAALVASSLAYGRVAQIHRSVAAVLDAIGAPRRFVERSTEVSLRSAFAGFRHRFTPGGEVGALLAGAKRCVEAFGGLEACFAAGMSWDDTDTVPALSAFACRLSDACGRGCASLLPVPDRGSACKRLHLFLRWMVRRDEVDPGGWTCVRASRLLVPLDTHMHRIGRALGFTRRSAADLGAAREVTSALARFAMDDPVRYDFALAHWAMEGYPGAETD
ncbi:MAG: TIGR02757 family protein [Planctomycetes bacterium]|nr:TIGR02757 family protein [Planctomycetota bacterium]